MEPALHVVFGAGQVGVPLARALLQDGHQVRIAKRTPRDIPDGAEIVLGDATDAAFCRRAADGAATVYHCMNPPYDAAQWGALLPRWMDNLIAAAGHANARLVVLDNVYMLGRPAGRPFDEETAPNPCSRKGEIRARVAERLFAAHRCGDVRATTGRASDFYGPGATLTLFGDQFWPRALRGKRSWFPIPLDMVHTYHYVLDVAAGLATLGCADDSAYGEPWMLPCTPAVTTRALVSRLAAACGTSLPLAAIPRWAVTAIGMAVPFIREVGEMLYQWDEPFVINDRRFRNRFHRDPVDPGDAAAATVAWAREHYSQTS